MRRNSTPGAGSGPGAAGKHSRLPLDVDAARRAAQVCQQLERSGIGIGMGDSLIAGIVLARGGSLLTRNKRHFERVPELLLADVRGT